MKDEEKELKYKIYLKSQEIKQLKNDIKELHMKIDQINGYKHLTKRLTKY